MTYKEKLSAEALRAEMQAKHARFKRTMGAVDRVLSRACEGLELADPTKGGRNAPPGWTDGITVTLNPSRLPPLVDRQGKPLTENLVVWLGINAHEVGHTLFTPRQDSPLQVKLKTMDKEEVYSGIRKIENLAEDQRQERLVIGKFRPWGTYLSAAAVRLIVEQVMGGDEDGNQEKALQENLHKMWPLLCGRTWLPAEVRRMARDAWDEVHGAGAGKRVADLIGAYQRLGDPGYEDANEAVGILTKLLTELNQQGATGDLPGGCRGEKGNPAEESIGGDMPDIGYTDDDNVPSAGSDADEGELEAVSAEDIAQAEGEFDRQLSNEDESDDSGESGESGESNESGEGSESGEGESAGEGQDEGEGSGEGDGSDSGEGEGQGEGSGSEDQGSGEGSDASGGEGGGESDDTGKSSGHGSGANRGSGVKKVVKLGDIQGPINESVRKALAHDAGVRRDLSDVKQSLEGNRKARSTLGHESKDPHRPSEIGAGTGSRNRHKKDQWIPASPQTRRMAREVSEHLRTLVDETLPQWSRRVEMGKLNVGRFMRREVGDPLDTMFDRFQQGMQDDVSLDVSIMVDVSSSMGWAPQLGPSPKDANGMPTTWPATIVPAAEAVWAIRRAVEAAEGDCTVYGFDNSGYIIHDTGRRPDADNVFVPQVGGGTDPTELIGELWQRLPAVQARHKIVIAVTDGQWRSGGQAMKELAERGVVTVGVVLDQNLNVVPGGNEARSKMEIEQYRAKRRAQAREKIEDMGVTYAEIMDNPHDMVPLFDKVASEVMLRAMQGVG